MSLANQLPRSTRRSDYDASDGPTVFGPADWLVFDPLDVRVRVKADADSQWQTLTTGYTVSLSFGTLGYPTVTLGAPLVDPARVRVEGRRVHPRTTDVTRAAALQSALLERELDKSASVLQELRRDIDDAMERGVLVPEGEGSFVLPAERAGKFLAFDDAGHPVMVAGVPYLPDVSSIIVSQSGAEAGLNNLLPMSALRTHQAVAAILLGRLASRSLAEIGLDASALLTPQRGQQLADAREGSILNPGGYDWSPVTRPPGGVTTMGTFVSRGDGPTGWYGGAGVGGQYQVSTPRMPKGIVPGDPETFIKLKWGASPTAGNPVDYPGSGWATYWEQFDVHAPQVGMGKTLTRRFVAGQRAAAIPTPIRARPIYWYSCGGLLFSQVAGGVVYTGEVFQDQNYAFRVITGGTLSMAAPVVPANQAAASIVSHGTAAILCLGPVKGNMYEIYEAHATPGLVKVATENVGAAALCEIPYSVSGWTTFDRTITMPEIGSTDTTTYAATGWPSRTLVEPQRRSARPYFGAGLDLDIVGQAPDLEFFDFDAFGFTPPVYRKAAKGLGLWLETLAASYPAHWLQRFIGEVRVPKTSVAGLKFSAVTGTPGSITSAIGHGCTIAWNSDGQFTVTFTQARSNTNYRVVTGSGNDGVNNFTLFATSYSNVGFNLACINTAGALVNPASGATFEVFDG